MALRFSFRGALCLGLATLLLPALADPPDERMPPFKAEIFVVGEAPFVESVAPGEPVRVVFGVGELHVEAADVDELRAEIRIDCRRVSEERCRGARRRLRIEPRRTAGGLEVRFGGISLRRLRKLDVDGWVTVPRSSPLDVRIGIGDANIVAGSESLSVRMKIGDLTVRAAERDVGTVSVRTRIGDSSIRGPGKTRRKMLLGSRSWWNEGRGDASIVVGLRIGDATVILE